MTNLNCKNNNKLTTTTNLQKKKKKDSPLAQAGCTAKQQRQRQVAVVAAVNFEGKSCSCQPARLREDCRLLVGEAKFQMNQLFEEANQ